MDKLSLDDTIKKIYKLSVSLYYDVADDAMERRGHPGIMGEDSGTVWNEQFGILGGTIETLKEVANKLKSVQNNKGNKQ